MNDDMDSQSDAVTSLLSLSIASSPIPPLGASSSPRQHPTTTSAKHHRRLGSAGKMRRRLSDAREACTRPLLASNTAALSLASLSLSASPPSTMHTASTSFGGICKPLAPKPHSHTNSIHIIPGSAPNPSSSDSTNFSLLASAATAAPPAAAGNAEHNDTTSTTPIPISNGKAGAKKRGIDYKCESCSKVYRHPNCLNKHRWEHTRQWREASKFVLSKHQQVQLLEAAAILSFMGKQPASLPEDRSEWPSFLSGGSLPKVEPVGGSSATTASSTSTSASSVPSTSSLASGLSSATSTSSLSHFHNNSSTTPTHSIHPISSSVPNPQSSGPRLHDYALKAPGGVTQVRPGLLLGVNNSNGDPYNTTGITASSAAAAFPMSMPAQQFTPPRTPHHPVYGYDYGYTPVVPTLGGGGEGITGSSSNPTWSLPNSSMRSVSHGRSLSSLSGSVSAQSEDDDGDIDIDIEDDEDGGYGRGRGRRVLVRSGGGRSGMGINVEGDADDMDNEEVEEDEDNDERHHHDNDDEEEEEGTQTQTTTEIFHHTHTRYNNVRYNHMGMGTQQQQQQQQAKPTTIPSTKWESGVGVDMDIEMDMDMD